MLRLKIFEGMIFSFLKIYDYCYIYTYCYIHQSLDGMAIDTFLEKSILKVSTI